MLLRAVAQNWMQLQEIRQNVLFVHVIAIANVNDLNGERKKLNKVGGEGQGKETEQ